MYTYLCKYLCICLSLHLCSISSIFVISGPGSFFPRFVQITVRYIWYKWCKYTYMCICAYLFICLCISVHTFSPSVQHQQVRERSKLSVVWTPRRHHHEAQVENYFQVTINQDLNVFGKSFCSRSSQFQRQEMVAPYSKRVLFVCERNLAESAMAEVTFQILSFLCMWKKNAKLHISPSFCSLVWLLCCQAASRCAKI